MREALKWDREGLVPVIVQDRLTGEIRMLAYANEAALAATEASGRATFFSRSRAELWEKGKTSGNVLAVSRVLVDCDGDALIYEADPSGPTCHTGNASCFFRPLTTDPDSVATTSESEQQTMLSRLEATLEARKQATSEKSYTRSLYDGGAARIGEKLREEAAELAFAVASEDDDHVASEAADVLFHLMVALGQRGVPFRRVLEKLDARTGKSGHEEKAARPKGAAK